MSWNNTVRCSYCCLSGHNKAGCEELRKRMEERREANPDDWRVREYFSNKQRSKQRSCAYCTKSGHNSRTCPVLASDKTYVIQNNSAARKIIFEKFNNMGFGRGALILENYWDTVCLVISINWDELDHRHLGEESYHSKRVNFGARNVESGKDHSFSMTLEALEKNILSPTYKKALIAPAGWHQGTYYCEEAWFNKKDGRHYFFRNNNII